MGYVKERIRTYIDFGGIGAATSRSNLRSNIDRCSNTSCLVCGIDIAGCEHTVSTAKLARCGEAKVTDLDAVHTVNTCTNKNILWLEISVHNAKAVNMCQAVEQLPEQSPDFLHILRQVSGDQIAKRL